MNKENLNNIIKLRHDLHMTPELSMQEEKTRNLIGHFLKNNTGLKVVECEGWLYAVKEGKKKMPAIAFRADMDALPIQEADSLPYHSLHEGISHKCGHDGHSAALCGLALELDQMETDRTVFLIFQPGEETGQGARVCKKLIREKNISDETCSYLW